MVQMAIESRFIEYLQAIAIKILDLAGETRRREEEFRRQNSEGLAAAARNTRLDIKNRVFPTQGKQAPQNERQELFCLLTSDS
jgi:hypothetical protein